MHGRVESHIVYPKMPPLEDGTVAAEPTEVPSPRLPVKRGQRTNRNESRSPPGDYTNIFTSRLNNSCHRRGISLHNLTPEVWADEDY